MRDLVRRRNYSYWSKKSWNQKRPRLRVAFSRGSWTTEAPTFLINLCIHYVPRLDPPQPEGTFYKMSIHCYNCNNSWVLNYSRSQASKRQDDPLPPPLRPGLRSGAPKHSLFGKASLSTSIVLKKKELCSTPILAIPGELLAQILSLAVEVAGNGGGVLLSNYHTNLGQPTDFRQYANALIISKVCKKFHRHAQAFLFRHIAIVRPHSLVPACKPAQDLHRTLKGKPELGALCKKVDFFIRGISDPEDYEVGKEIVRWLPNVTTFQLMSDVFYPVMWLFVKHTLGNMPDVDNIAFVGYLCELPLGSAWDVVKEMQLRSLTLGGIVTPYGIKDPWFTRPVRPHSNLCLANLWC